MKQAERMRMTKLRKDIQMRRLVTQKMIAKRLSSGGHVERMIEERLPRRVELHEETRTRIEKDQ